jgi:hypothetical protein
MTEHTRDEVVDMEEWQGNDEESSNSLQIHTWIFLEEDSLKMSCRPMEIMSP